MVKRLKPVIILAGIAVVAGAMMAQATTTTGEAAVTATWQNDGTILVDLTYPADVQCYLYRQDEKLSWNFMTNWVQAIILPRFDINEPMHHWQHSDYSVEPGRRYKYQIRTQNGINEGLEWVVLAESNWAGGQAPTTAPVIGIDSTYGLWGLETGIEYEIGISTDNGDTWDTRYVIPEGVFSVLPPNEIPKGSLIRVRKTGHKKNQYGYAYRP